MTTTTISQDAARPCLTTTDARSFAAGHLTPDAAREIDEHCDGCERCSDLVAAAVEEATS